MLLDVDAADNKLQEYIKFLYLEKILLPEQCLRMLIDKGFVPDIGWRAVFWEMLNGSTEGDRYGKFVELIWEFIFLPNSERVFEELTTMGTWKFPDIDSYPYDSECRIRDDFFRAGEKEIHKVPRVFELLDYFLKRTEYKYSEKFGTQCCHFRNIPYFHFAMDPCTNDFHIREGGTSKNLFEKVVEQTGMGFFIDRYPRFFDPEISNRKGNAFISEGERRLAYLFQKYTLKKEVESYRRFAWKTRVSYESPHRS